MRLFKHCFVLEIFQRILLASLHVVVFHELYQISIIEKFQSKEILASQDLAKRWSTKIRHALAKTALRESNLKKENGM